MVTEAQTSKQTLQGTVVSNKMDKTAVVLVERRVPHKLYGKIMKRSKKFKVHDESNSCEMNDVVIIQSIAPMSKTKTWTLLKIVERSE